MGLLDFLKSSASFAETGSKVLTDVTDIYGSFTSTPFEDQVKSTPVSTESQLQAERERNTRLNGSGPNDVSASKASPRNPQEQIFGSDLLRSLGVSGGGSNTTLLLLAGLGVFVFVIGMALKHR